MFFGGVGEWLGSYSWYIINGVGAGVVSSYDVLWGLDGKKWDPIIYDLWRWVGKEWAYMIYSGGWEVVSSYDVLWGGWELVSYDMFYEEEVYIYWSYRSCHTFTSAS